MVPVIDNTILFYFIYVLLGDIVLLSFFFLHCIVLFNIITSKCIAFILYS